MQLVGTCTHVRTCTGAHVLCPKIPPRLLKMGLLKPRRATRCMPTTEKRGDASKIITNMTKNKLKRELPL